MGKPARGNLERVGYLKAFIWVSSGGLRCRYFETGLAPEDFERTHEDF
jgi:hypothetical protein